MSKAYENLDNQKSENRDSFINNFGAIKKSFSDIHLNQNDDTRHMSEVVYNPYLKYNEWFVKNSNSKNNDLGLEKHKNFDNNIVFSKISNSRQNHGRPQKHNEYYSNPGKDNSKRISRKKKRNIHRDPDDKRHVLKKVTSISYNNASEKRPTMKNSIASNSIFGLKDETGTLIYY